MKRIIFSSLIVSSMTFGANAARIPYADALGIAEGFMATRGIAPAAIHHATPTTRSATPSPDGESDAPYHIFNIGDGDGFIIVAADDRLPSILGYSLQGSVSPDRMPQPCAAWLDAHAEVLSRIPTQTPAKAIEYPAFKVEPLLSTRWDQNDPYNRLCPTDKATGLHAAVGCVATAAAQVMGYYRYPATPSGKVEYEDRRQNETRTFDFSAMAPIDWDHIADTYTSGSPAEDCEAVATLMNAVAHGVKMQFSETSAAYHYDAGHALIDFFGYSPEIHYYERALLSDQEWISIITSELQAGRPVLYEGVNPSMGHAFVCDGYDGQGFFHINWGWSGLSDGYFSLSALTPPSQSTGGSDSGYALRQTILCNVAPKGTPGLLPQEKGLLNIDRLYFRDSSAFHSAADNMSVTSPLADAQLFFYSFNRGMKPFSGEVCAAIANAGDVSPLAIVPVDDLPSQNYTSVRFPLTDLRLPEGTSRISFHYRTTPEGVWHPIRTSAAGAPSQCFVTLSDKEATMSAVDPDIRPEMVETITHSRLYTNAKASFGFELSNSGSSRLEANAGVALMQPDGQYVAFYSTPVLCPAEDSVKVEIKADLKGIDAGEYLLIPFYSYTGQPEPADIKLLAYRPTAAAVEGVTMTPAAGNYFMIEPGKTTLDLTATNLLALGWTAPVAVEIVSQPGSVIGILKEAEISLGPSETSSISFDCSPLTLPRGSYMARFVIADGSNLQLAEIPVLVTKDISSVAAVEAEGIEVSVAGDITVTSSEGLASMTLYDTTGRIIADIRPGGCSASIPASGLTAGIYVLRVATENGKTASRKLRL